MALETRNALDAAELILLGEGKTPAPIDGTKVAKCLAAKAGAD